VESPSRPTPRTSEDFLMPKALIVEDEPEANELLAMLVQLRGYDTLSAFTGHEALEKVELARPDIVFLDLMLPDVNGYDICRHLKSHRATSGIPVVMVTARLAAENRLHGFRVGATDYVPKPYTPDQIFGAMEQADVWRSKLDGASLEGVIPLDARSEVSHFREISRLWSLLLERTSLSEDAARALDQTLVELASRAVDWGVRTGHGLVASLDFHCDQQGIVFTLRDESDWFLADPPRKPEGLGGLIGRGHFDQVVTNERQSQVTLTRLFSHQS
jgi:DNA-binding response OmpR family regulator